MGGTNLDAQACFIACGYWMGQAASGNSEKKTSEAFVNFKMRNMSKVNGKKDNVLKRKWSSWVSVVLLTLVNNVAKAQDGISGINEANTKVRSYFDVGVNLMYAVGAILGLIGAVRVYQKWSSGQPDTGSTAAAWFGSCVFLVIVATVLKSFFGL